MKSGTKRQYKDLKVKPGQILFVPCDNRLLEMQPHVNSSSNPPGWFRKIGKFPGSLRRCAGISDYLSIGVTFPAWSNFRFKNAVHDSIWEVSTDQFELSKDKYPLSVQSFELSQTGECPMTNMRNKDVKNGSYPKLVNPWRIMTAPGWSTIVLPNLFEPNKNYTIIPAIVHTDFYHTLNIVLNITGNEDFNINYGDPFVQLIPFKRDLDFNEALFEDEDVFKYVITRGFGSGGLSLVPGLSTARPYRMEKIKVDKELKEKEHKKFWKRNN